MRRLVELLVIRWALKRLQLLNPSAMSYGQLGRYGVEDIIQSSMGEDAYVLTPVRRAVAGDGATEQSGRDRLERLVQKMIDRVGR